VSLPKFAALLLAVLCAWHRTDAAIWHVDAASGRDTQPGESRATAFATLQRAVDGARPGDTIIVYPGTYYEHVVIRRGGAPEAPITIQADRVERDRVILSGADASIRQGRVAWEPVDGTPGLYRVPLAYRPTRVLADRVDLLAYPTLADLRAFRFLDADYLGHPHGFSHDPETGHLYVRLRADGRYGATDPNQTTMAVSPPNGGGRFGAQTTHRPDNYNLAIPFSGPAHVVIDGITFETPGIAGIFTAASDVTIRNSWFYGCRVGIAGVRTDDPAFRDRPTADRVVVEHCYFTQFPAYTDIEAITPEEVADQRGRTRSPYRPAHWQRKGNHTVGRAWSYEVGAIRGIGDRWEIHHNHFHDMFEALSDAGRSTNTVIHHNRFERICDNAIEAEPRARDLHVHHNLIIDTFEPISWQPLDGPPLPGPVIIHDNIILQTERAQAMATANTGGVFKLGIGRTNRYWQTPLENGALPEEAAAPGGFWIAHNTIYHPSGRLLTPLNLDPHPLRGFHVLNNLVVTHTFSTRTASGGVHFDGNIARFAGAFPSVLAVATVPELAAIAAGPHGRAVSVEDDNPGLHLPLDETTALAPYTEDSPLRDTGIDATKLPADTPTPESLPLRATPGAEPFTLHVGPRSRS